MSTYDVDLEKQSPTVTTELMSSGSPSLASPALEKYQALIGDVDSPIISKHNVSIYNDMMLEERSATIWYYVSASILYTLIAAQIVLCLGITTGSKMGLSRDTICILAGLNTGVAAGIAVMRGFALPEKKDHERQTLRVLIGKVRETTTKLRAGVEVDVVKESDETRKAFGVAGVDARFNVADFGAAAEGGFMAIKDGLGKKQ